MKSSIENSPALSSLSNNSTTSAKTHMIHATTSPSKGRTLFHSSSSSDKINCMIDHNNNNMNNNNYDDPSPSTNSMSKQQQKPGGDEQKVKKIVSRVLSGFLMLLVFGLILYAGHVYVCTLIFVLEVFLVSPIHIVILHLDWYTYWYSYSMILTTLTFVLYPPMPNALLTIIFYWYFFFRTHRVIPRQPCGIFSHLPLPLRLTFISHHFSSENWYEYATTHSSTSSRNKYLYFEPPNGCGSSWLFFIPIPTLF